MSLRYQPPPQPRKPLFCALAGIIQQLQRVRIEVEEDNQPEPEPSENNDDDDNDDGTKQPDLFARYRLHQRNSRNTSVRSSEDEYQRYIEIQENLSGGKIDAFEFWSKHASQLPRLSSYARKVLVTPATSAPVERIFSHGGILMRAHRASMTDSTLSSVLFLKCNRLFQTSK